MTSTAPNLMDAAQELLDICLDMFPAFRDGSVSDMLRANEIAVSNRIERACTTAFGGKDMEQIYRESWTTTSASPGLLVIDKAMHCHAGRVYLAAKLLPVDRPRDIHEAQDFVRAWNHEVVSLDPVDELSYLLWFDDDSIYILHSDAQDSFHPNIHEWVSLENRTLVHAPEGWVAWPEPA